MSSDAVGCTKKGRPDNPTDADNPEARKYMCTAVQKKNGWRSMS